MVIHHTEIENVVYQGSNFSPFHRVMKISHAPQISKKEKAFAGEVGGADAEGAHRNHRPSYWMTSNCQNLSVCLEALSEVQEGYSA